MKLKVRIITPNGVFADDKEVNSAYLQTTDGDMTILPKHSPLVSTLKIGTMTLSNDSEKTFIHVHRGLVKVDNESVKIITERLYLVDESGSKIKTPDHI
jgi:F-type H+-transporting ATPase subunit epsilon